MRIIAVTRVRNEEDVIEPLLRHHAALVDGHIVLDNGSTDRSPEIVRALADEGMMLHMVEDRAAYFAETQHNTMLYRTAVRDFGADWVVFLDADEFIDPRGIGSLSGFLASLPQQPVSLGLQLRDYAQMPAGPGDSLNVLERLRWRNVAPSNNWKVIVRRVADPDAVIVDAGNHHIYLRGAYEAPLRQDHLVLGHFPARSPFQWAAKAAIGRLRVLAAGMTEIVQNRAIHYTGFYEAFKADPRVWIAGVSGRRPQEAAAGLIEDPVPYLGGPLLHTRPIDYGARALRFVLEAAESIAVAHGHLRDRLTEPPPAPVGPLSRRYRVAPLAALAAGGLVMPDGAPRVERFAFLPPAAIDLPPFAYPAGSDDAVCAEAAARRVSVPALDFWLLRNALVHGSAGHVSLDDLMVHETSAHFPPHAAPGVSGTEVSIDLPDMPHSVTAPAAYHLLSANHGSFHHWMADVLARFDPGLFEGIGSAQEAPGSPVLLVPPLDLFWKWETLNSLLPGTIARIAMAERGQVFAQRLLFVPELSAVGSGLHPALLRPFARIAAALGHEDDARPWRRLYIAGGDSGNRVLVNEAAVIAEAERAGFTPVVLSTMSVAEQARLFHQASHIIAPHGAGLANIGYCRPGTRLCELHMAGELGWAFRRLAALRGMRYACLVGERIGPAPGSPHGQSWRIDPNAVAAVLSDPAFVG
jgi:capsular polysaccharide biosynthesis protein